jgi:hypothetical protein
LFKAQLFLPYQTEVITTDHGINLACIRGYYLKKTQLEQFKTCKFYIPTKADWLIIPHVNVPWLDYKTFSEHLHPILDKQTAPLVWIKHPNGQIDVCFVVWW